MEDTDQYDLDDCLAAVQLYQLEKKMEELRATMKIMEQAHEDFSQIYEAWRVVFQQIKNIRTNKQLLNVGETPVQERILI